MSVINYVEDKSTSEFYPTPESLIQMMSSKVNWNYVKTVLEPSVGKGDIVRYLNRRTDGKLDIDCIEIDNNLRQIFLYTFSEENSNRLLDEKKKITKQYNDFDSWSENYKYYNQELRQYVPVPEPDNSRLRAIDTERKEVKGENVHLVHDDFLTFTAYKQYNVIIMNPPFSNGDKHLLKALEIQKYGGQIVCLLNAETIRNPYTETRKELIKILNDYNANIEYYSGEFNNAERQTDVEVAMIYVNIPMSVNDNDDSIFDKLKKEEHYEEPTAEEITALDVTDYLRPTVDNGFAIPEWFKDMINESMGKVATLRTISQYKQNYIAYRTERNAYKNVLNNKVRYANSQNVNDIIVKLDSIINSISDVKIQNELRDVQNQIRELVK